jgi:large subunit ribosomal protein L49
MLANLKHLMPVRGTRCYSQLQSAAAASTRQISPSFPSETSMHATDVRYPYFIRRNSRGSLPVYTDIRNGGTRYLVSIRNVHGQINVSTPSSTYLAPLVF